jgi:hypothetical protein
LSHDQGPRGEQVISGDFDRRSEQHVAHS